MGINRDKVYDGAMKLLATGKFDKGIVELQKLVVEDPKDVRTLLKIGETLHVKMGKRKEALEAYDKAASVYSEQGFFLKAVAVFKQMLSVDATSPELHLRLAELYQQMGYGAQCLHHYQQVVVLYEQQGRGKDMLAVLKRMVDLDPENLQSRVKVAELFHMQGMVQEAAAEMRQAFDFLHGQSRFDDAVRVGEKVCAWDPNAVDIARKLGAIYMQRGEAKSALTKLQLCYAHAPRDVEVLGLIAGAFLAIDQLGKTISVYKEMARIHEGDGNVGEARRCWEMVLQYAPGDDDAEGALGRRQQAPAVAPVLSAPVAAANPEDEALKRLLTETDVYVKYGLRPKAIEHLDKIFELRPEYLPALEKLRQLQKQMKQAGPALETLRRMVAKARETNHPKSAEWAIELSQLDAPAAQKPLAPTPRPAPVVAPKPPAPVVRRDMSVEGEVVLVDEDLPPPAPAPRPVPVRPPPTPPTPLDEPLDEPRAPVAARPIRGAPPPRVAALDESLDEPFESPAPSARRFAPVLDEPLDEPPSALASSPPSLPEDEPDSDAIARAAIGDWGDEPASSWPEAPADELVLEQEAPVAAPLIDDDMGMLDALAAQAVQEALPTHFGAGTPPPVEDDFGERTVAYGSDDWNAQVRAAQVQATADDSIIETGERLRASASAMAVAEETGLVVPPTRTLADARAVPPPVPVDDFPEAPAGRHQRADAADEFNPGDFDLPDDVRAMLASPPPVGPEPVAATLDGDDDYESLTTGNYEAADEDVQSLASVEAEAIDDDDIGARNVLHGVDDDDVANAFDAIESDGDGLPAMNGSHVVPAYAAPPPDVDDVPDAPSMSRALFAPERGFEDDPANTFFPDELAEAEFFIQQELLDEAREILEPILEEIEDSERVKHMLARVAAKEAGEPEPPPPWQQRIFEDLAAEAAPSPELSDPGQISVEDVLSQFKRGIAQTVPEDDAATHYDLGIAYREMGLLDDAIGEFEVSARAASKAPDAWFLVGLVRLEQGRSDDALDAFDKAVGAPTASRDQQAAAEYQRGVVFADHQDNGIEGLVALKRSKLLGGSAPDLDRRIQALVKVYGDVDGGAAMAGRPKNVDYV